MTRQTHKSRLETAIPWLGWNGNPWAPWARIGPYRIEVHGSQTAAVKWLSAMDRKIDQPVVLYMVAGHVSRCLPVGNDQSLVHGVIEMVKDIRMDVILVARQLQMDTASLAVNPEPKL